MKRNQRLDGRWESWEVSAALVVALAIIVAVVGFAAGTWLGWISRLFF